MSSTDSQGNYVAKTLSIEIVFPTVATLALIGRFYARRVKGLDLWWDDWTALLSLVWVWAFFICVAVSIPLGNARHIDQVDPANLETILKITWVYQIFYVLAPTTVKISALLLYKRIFISQTYTRIVVFLIWLMVCWGIASVLISIFSCSPPSAFWTGVGKCISWHAWVVAFAVPNIFFDFLIWLLPIPRIWIMQLPRHHKIALTVIFLLGLTDCAAAIVRISTAAEALGQADYTYTWIPATWWCVLHPSIGIITICLPTMRVLMTKAGRVLFGKSWSGSRDDYGSKDHHDGNPNSSKRSGGSRWPRRSPYDELRDVGLSLSGETDHNLHSNTIALALRKNSENTMLGEGEIKVTSDFKIETTHEPSLSERRDSSTLESRGSQTLTR